MPLTFVAELYHLTSMPVCIDYAQPLKFVQFSNATLLYMLQPNKVWEPQSGATCALPFK
jgi:hypothetical protein